MIADGRKFLDVSKFHELVVLPGRVGDLAEAWPYRLTWDGRGRLIHSGFKFVGVWFDDHTIQTYGEYL